MVRINGTEIKGLSLKYNGTILTLTGMNLGMTLTKFAQILSDEPKIELVENGSVRAIYQSMQMRTLTMETLGGVPVITVSMVAKPVDVPESGGTDESVIKELKEVREMARVALDAVMAIEEGMADV